MKKIEVKLREGMTRNGITPQAQEDIIQQITSFALYGFPESHAASFALLAYASAYLKTHYLAAFTAALLNNQPMGFYNPSTIVKDAQRHGLKILPIDILHSDWLCTIEEQTRTPVIPTGAELASTFSAVEGPAFQSSKHQLIQSSNPLALRLGLRYIRGLREEAARAIIERRLQRPFASIDELARRVPELRKNELVALAEIGALNSLSPKDVVIPSAARNPYRYQASVIPTEAERASAFSAVEGPAFQSPDAPITRWPDRFHRRDALWQVERATRHPGPLLEDIPEHEAASPLAPMSPDERLVADFRGTGLTVGPHAMAYRRTELDKLRIRRAAELPHLRNGQRVRMAGCVICRQRPGTASGFVFLSLEDETGIANAIIKPDLFERNRLMLVSEQFLVVEGILQNLDGVISVRADRVHPLDVTQAETSSHDFH